jgi:hypothetical protein
MHGSKQPIHESDLGQHSFASFLKPCEREIEREREREREREQQV